MDKLAVNQQIVLMRKVVKHSQRYLILNLTKQGKMLKESVEKLSSAGEEQKAEALKLKLKRVNAQKVFAKSVPVDMVSKEALKNVDSWQKIIDNPKTSHKQRVIAKIASYPLVQKSVEKFRKDHTDWQLYLNTLLELWDEKKKIQQNIPTDSSENAPNDDLETAKTEKKLKMKKSEKEVSTSKISPSKQNKKNKNVEKVAKSAKRLKTFENNEVVETEVNSEEKTEDAEEQFDNFFVNKKSKFPSVEESDKQSNVKQTQGKFGKKFNDRNTHGNKFNDRNTNGNKYNDRNTHGNKYNDRNAQGIKYNDRNAQGKQWNSDGKKFTQRETYSKFKHSNANETNQFNSSKPAFTKGKQNFKEFKNQDESGNRNEKLHPSWEAKRQQKQVLKIDFNNCQAKKIKFD